jgi:hypothetical protein
VQALGALQGEFAAPGSDVRVRGVGGAFPGHPDSRGATLNYDAEVLTAYVTTLEITDARLQRIWGPEVHRIELVEKNTPLAATRTFEIRPTD